MPPTSSGRESIDRDSQRAQAAFLEAVAAPGRVLLLRELIREPQTFLQLQQSLSLSPAGIRQGLSVLVELGYVHTDSPAGDTRKRRNSVFTVDYKKLLTDLADFTKYLLGAADVTSS